MNENGQRPANRMRELSFEVNYLPNAHGSCFVKMGNTWVICTATVENRVPFFLKNTGSGWLTAEYGMLPGATNTRTQREAARGAQVGRTQEIQRLIGRSLRTALDLEQFGEKQIIIDCDVVQADGGTRVAAINGGYIALCLALKNMQLDKVGHGRRRPLLRRQISAISCGIVDSKVILDMDFFEDSSADADANFVLDTENNIVEVQGTAEKRPFSTEEMMNMLKFAQEGCDKIRCKQMEVLNACGYKA
jgi:ribonuclease PH